MAQSPVLHNVQWIKAGEIDNSLQWVEWLGEIGRILFVCFYFKAPTAIFCMLWLPLPPPIQPTEAEVQTDYANLRRNRSSECILVCLKSLLYENRLGFFFQVFSTWRCLNWNKRDLGDTKLGWISLEQTQSTTETKWRLPGLDSLQSTQLIGWLLAFSTVHFLPTDNVLMCVCGRVCVASLKPSLVTVDYIITVNNFMYHQI